MHKIPIQQIPQTNCWIKNRTSRYVIMINASIAHLFIALVLVAQCFAAQKVFLKDAASQIIPNANFLIKNASATQGSSVQTCVTNTIAGDVTGQYWPSSTAGHIITKTGGGTRTIWLSAPLSAGFTISGTITPNIRGLESASAANSAFRYEIRRWLVSTGGIGSQLGISGDNGTGFVSEWTTSETTKTAPTMTPTSTAFVTGDRIVFIIYNDDGSGVTETAASRTWTLFYDGATGATGDSYFTFTENLTFSADSNNAPARTGHWLRWFLSEPSAYMAHLLWGI